MARALAEDIGPLGDLTAALVPATAVARCTVSARAAGVIAGGRCAEETFARVDPAIVGALARRRRRAGGAR